jgi:ribonuclease P protein subunit RPR2
VESEIARLLRAAETLARAGRREESRLIVAQALELSKSTRVRVPRRLKRWICRNCKAPLIPGVNASVRLRSQGGMSYVVVRCLWCGWIHRRPYKKRSPPAPPGGEGGEEPEGEGEEGAPRES